MPTVNHVCYPNVPPATPPFTGNFKQFWALTRALKKAGWKYLGSGDGTTKDATKNPALDKWNNSTPTVTSGLSMAIAAPLRGRSVVTGLSGITASMKGMFLVPAGSSTPANNNAHQIEEVLSATSVAIDARNFAVAADAGPLSWSIIDYRQDVYPTTWHNAAGWWAARGPSIIRVPYTVAQTPGAFGKFMRGENVTQSSTGAQGECLGVYEDGANSYMAISPRVRGTGSGVYGWDTTFTITGALSGATIAQNGTAKEYRAELVIQKNANQTTGVMCMHYAEPVGEVTAESLMPSAGCTATVGPGQGGTGNGFPTFAWIFQGSAVNTGQNWSLWSSTSAGNAQIVAYDAIEEAGYSADGSWLVSLHQATQSALPYASGHLTIGFFRLDDTEPGDCCPFVTKTPGYGSGTLYTNTRTTLGGQTTTWYDSINGFAGMSSYLSLRGWRRRGMSDDAATNSQDYEFAVDWAQLQSTYSQGPQNLFCFNNYNVQHAPVFTKQIRRIGVACMSGNIRKSFKGTLRHLMWLEGGMTFSMYENRTIIQLSLAYSGSTGLGPCIIDGWDGVTTPFGITG